MFRSKIIAAPQPASEKEISALSQLLSAVSKTEVDKALENMAILFRDKNKKSDLDQLRLWECFLDMAPDHVYAKQMESSLADLFTTESFVKIFSLQSPTRQNSLLKSLEKSIEKTLADNRETLRLFGLIARLTDVVCSIALHPEATQEQIVKAIDILLSSYHQTVLLMPDNFYHGFIHSFDEFSEGKTHKLEAYRYDKIQAYLKQGLWMVLDDLRTQAPQHYQAIMSVVMASPMAQDVLIDLIRPK